MPAERNEPEAPNTTARQRARYMAILDGLQVESNPRYQRGRRGHGETYCNLFVADATQALGAPIPLWTLSDGGARRYLRANAMQDWLLTEGAALGWRRVTDAEAQRAANAGRPAVATWKNSDSAHSGHMAMLRPGPVPVAPERGPRIAQAGRHNYRSTEAVVGFGSAARLAEIIYFVFGADPDV
jgi:hypothetical protein